MSTTLINSLYKLVAFANTGAPSDGAPGVATAPHFITPVVPDGAGGGALWLSVKPSTASVTVTVWIYDESNAAWMPWVVGLAVTGSAKSVPIPAQSRVYFEVTANASSPLLLSVFWGVA